MEMKKISVSFLSAALLVSGSAGLGRAEFLLRFGEVGFDAERFGVVLHCLSDFALRRQQSGDLQMKHRICRSQPQSFAIRANGLIELLGRGQRLSKVRAKTGVL